MFEKMDFRQYHAIVDWMTENDLFDYYGVESEGWYSFVFLNVLTEFRFYDEYVSDMNRRSGDAECATQSGP